LDVKKAEAGGYVIAVAEGRDRGTPVSTLPFFFVKLGMQISLEGV